MPLRPDLAEQIVRAEMLGSFLAIGPALPDHFGLDLFRENVSSFVRDAGGYRLFRDRTQGLHVRDWIGRGTIPRMDSLARLSRGLNVCLARLFTERIDTGKKPDQKCFWKAHYRVASNAVEVALRAALQVAIPPALLEIANQLGYQSVASLQSRYPALCSEVASKRRAAIKASPPSLAKSSVPRERIETALIAALRDPGFTGLGALAVSVGLSSKRRLYKDFHDLRVAIVAKNATIKNRRLKATEATISTAIGAALGAAFNEQPVPTVAEVAQRLGYATAKPLTSRFPELTTELRLCRQRFRQVKCGHRVNERIRQRLTEALGEFPPPSCAEVVRSVCGHRTKIREAFQELWRALHRRYVEHVQEAYRVKREAFAREVYRAVLELHRQGVYPIVRLVLATIPQPQFRSREIVAETVRLARHELSVKPHEAYRGQRCSGAAVNCRTNSTFAETPNGVVRP
jgi:hypothetical protein